jgi:UDP-N-acetylmuramoylalanine-D-glutamate ligase
MNKIGIIGLGIVGKTLFDWLKKKKIDVKCYDKILNPELFETIWKMNFQYLKKQKLLKKLYEDWLNNRS